MEDLKKEIADLKTCIDAMAVVMKTYSNSIDVLTLKLEELQDNNDPKIEVEELAEFIESKFYYLAPSTIQLSWSDGGFTADYEIDMRDMIEEEMSSRWAETIAEWYVEKLIDSRK
jgi:hypothetical protein